MRQRGVNRDMSQKESQKAQGRGQKVNLVIGLSSLVCLAAEQAIWMQPASAAPQPLRVVVNSDQDTIQADDGITLREAIALVNGTLSLDKLSATEKAQVSASDRPQITFSLPDGRTTIRLSEVLPDLAAPGLTIDGTIQTGYSDQVIINEAPLTVPAVAITPADGKTVFRGLTVVADNITIRGLSLYGFTGEPLTTERQNTLTTPPADIFIAHRLPPPDLTKQPTPANFSPFYADDVPPKGTIIENNWLGIPPSADGTARTQGPRSAFGVSVFNGVGTVIRRNWIADHEGSGIITSVKAEGMQVSENALIGNGVAGMPDGIRLEGEINEAKISSNVICANDGSGVYLFKPNGAVQIRDNQITYNGRRLRRAAVYLMGNNHQVANNQISYQAGPGVVVAAYPKSRGSAIQSNRFTNNEGQSIDLVAQNHTDVFAYQKGDGPNPPRDNRTDVVNYQRKDGLTNPPRDSRFRRRETGNAGVAAPQFATKAFVTTGAPLQILGKADPGSSVELYRVSSDRYGYGSLLQPIGTGTAGEKGDFSITVSDVQPGQEITAIATDSRLGTSEQAASAQIQSLSGEASPSTPSETPPSVPPSSVPQCVTQFVPPKPPEEPPTPIVLKVPKNVHFALDKSFISARSAQVLDRIAQALLDNSTIIVEIQGHTDPRASDEYNLALGARRAISVRNYLLRKGIANERMTIRSFGERRLLSPGRSKLDFARDRRVEIDYKDARNIEIIVQEEDLQIEP
jgi:outer membrane protein OmpA-like peptidoglycan-associated protein